jgi:hypothetical protein
MGSSSSLIEIVETKQHVRLAIKRPSLRYLDEFLGLKCAPDMLAQKLFPNAKEITESFGAYNAARAYNRRGFPLSDPSIRCFVIGDGSTPRTAATFAFRSLWICDSVDPALKNKPSRTRSIWNLLEIARKWEDFAASRGGNGVSGKKVVVVAVHARIKLEAILGGLKDVEDLLLIAMPCCVRQELLDGYKPKVEYADWGVHSPHRIIRIWRGTVSDFRYTPRTFDQTWDDVVERDGHE